MALSKAREKLIRRLRKRRTRVREEAVLVEGVRGVREAVRSGATVRFLVCAPRLRTTEAGEALIRRVEHAAIEMVWVEDGTFARLADTVTPQGVLAVVVRPEIELKSLDPDPHPRILVLDAVQDPGNVGTLFRGAAAFGLDAVIVLEGSADPWSPKVVRGSAGAPFYLPVVSARREAALEWLRAREVPVLIADAAGEDVRDLSPPRAWALVLGNEAVGVHSTLQTAGRPVGIKIHGDVDSLNVAVAGSILMHALGQPAR